MAMIELRKADDIGVNRFLPDGSSVRRVGDERPEQLYSGQFKVGTNLSSVRRLEELTASGKHGVFIGHATNESPIARHPKSFLEQALVPKPRRFVSSDYPSIKSGKELYGEILQKLKCSRTVLAGVS